ncbi:glycosyltransferase 87 family protein [Nocardioides litoris]|uniref:glycosyltransferase 87 family protein n=1 Tax=Nocardioides litoris TaxID=1926648 RepID=UPI0014773428|nr:glycosyltransferase 87 family protein [Nocardioides litoris]
MTHVHPTREDGVVRGLSEVVGGPVGDHAGPPAHPPAGRAAGGGPRVTVLGVLLAATALTFALGLVSKAACAGQDWSTTDPSRYTHVCVSEVPDAWTGEGLAELAWPWSGDAQTRQRYPVTQEPALVGLWTYATARATHLLAGAPDVEDRYAAAPGDLASEPDVVAERQVFAAVNAVGLAGSALLATLALWASRRRRPWDAAVLAAAPVLALAGFVSFDLLPVVAVAGALWAWSRNRLVVAGVLVGLGAAAGVWPVLVLAAYALLCLRDRRPALLLPPLVTAVGVWALANAPAFVSGRAQWEVFWTAAWRRTADQGSLWFVLDDVAGLDQALVRGLAWGLVGSWWAGVLALVLLAPERPRLSQVALLLVAGVLVLGPTYEPEQALWLLPLAALAHPRWRDLLVWQACEAAYLALLWWWRGGLLSPGSGGSAGFYWLAIAVHLLGTLWLVAAVARTVWSPRRDVVRATEGLPAQVTSTRSTRVVV